MYIKGFFEYNSLLSLSIKDIIKIYEIEQDMWAHILWEFVKCNNCNKIFSKKDIFWWLDKSLYINNVSSIISSLGIKNINCVFCNWVTKYIYDYDYIYEIINRHKNDSILVLYKNDDSNLLTWFCDGYYWYFDEIYINEFKKYYSNIEIYWFIKNKLGNIINKKIFVLSAIGLEAKFKSLDIVYRLLLYFLRVPSFYNIPIIFESRIGTKMHEIYMFTWAERLWISTNNKFINMIENSNKDYISDIFIYKNPKFAYKKLINLINKNLNYESVIVN